MANNAEEEDWSSDSGSSEEESEEEELRDNIEFHFGAINQDSEDEEEAEAGHLDQGPGPDQPQEARIEENEAEVNCLQNNRPRCPRPKKIKSFRPRTGPRTRPRSSKNQIKFVVLERPRPRPNSRPGRPRPLSVSS